jgi:hypothetical protein
MSSDPVVRSIQIASTLVDRLGELVHPSLGSKLAGVVGGPAGDALELRVGEAQQIAPEIWRHLDDARRGLVERGIDVADFDEIRRHQDPAMLATKSIEVKRKLDLLALVQGEVRITEQKNVQWDAAGWVRGVLACIALKAKLPDVDWDALDEAAHAEIAEVGSLKTARWKATAKWIALAAGIATIAIVIYLAFGRSDPVADATAVKEREKQALVDRAHAERKVKIAELRAKLEAAPCNVAIKERLITYLLAARLVPEANQLEQAFAARCAPDAAPTAIETDAAPE